MGTDKAHENVGKIRFIQSSSLNFIFLSYFSKASQQIDLIKTSFAIRITALHWGVAAFYAM